MTSFPITISIGLLVLGLGLLFVTFVFQGWLVGLETLLWNLLQELGAWLKTKTGRKNQNN